MDATSASGGALAVATGLDAGTILAAGAYGTALLFFAYGGYALLKAKSAEQSKNVRWYLGIGAVVALAMIGFDAFKQQIGGARAQPDVFLAFSPKFSAVGLPEPAVESRGQALKLSAPIRVSDQSSINISVDAIIEKVKGLQQNNQQLRSALGSAALAGQPKELGERIAAADSAGQDPCASGGDATLCPVGTGYLCQCAALGLPQRETALRCAQAPGDLYQKNHRADGARGKPGKSDRERPRIL